MTANLSYASYQQQLAHGISPSGVARYVAQTAPTVRFGLTAAGWRAQPYAGIAIITPPFIDDPVNHAAYVALADIQQQFILDLGLDIIGLLPVSSLHLTVTGLVSGDSYLPFAEPAARAALFAQVRMAFANTAGIPAPALRFKGLCPFGPVIAAVLDFVHEGDYLNLLRLRDAIYQHTGELPKPAPFTAHVTLLHKTFTGDAEKVRATEAIHRVNADIPWQALPPFNLHRAEVRFFPDMTRFTREADWPVYRFAPGQ